MLKALTIENFKAFGEPTRIEFAPITLIYGQNSAGKSSILQALNQLKQTHESRESGTSLLPRAEDGIVDLGSFRELLFDHDERRTLRIGVEADIERRHPIHRKAFGRQTFSALMTTLGFGLDDDSQEVRLKGLTFALASSEDRFADFVTRSLTPEEQRSVHRSAFGIYRGRRLSRRQRVLGAECKWITQAHDFWEPAYRAWSSRQGEVHEALLQLRTELSSRWRRVRDVTEEEGSEREERELEDALAQAIRFHSEPFSLTQFIHRMAKGWRGSILALDGFIPLGTGLSGRQRLPEIELLDRFRWRSNLSLPTNDVTSLAYVAGQSLEDVLTALFPMGPFRRPPERWYIFTGTSPEDVGYRGDHLPDLLFRRRDLVDHANRWLTKLEIGYQLRVKSIGERDTDLFEVRLVDTRRRQEVEVGLSDVGFGISQILPFLVQSLASESQIISIEQPEVHIHPRLQADLGDLIAECIKEPFQHQYLIETHSEHLVLRLQRLVRTGKLKPSDISVLFVERGPCGSRVQRLHLDDSGEFIDEWPGGFFSERLRELI